MQASINNVLVSRYWSHTRTMFQCAAEHDWNGIKYSLPPSFYSSVLS